MGQNPSNYNNQINITLQKIATSMITELPSFYFIQGGKPVKFAKNTPTMYSRRGTSEKYINMVKHFIQNLPDGV